MDSIKDTDITKLSPWIVEVVKMQQNVDRGSLNFSLLKNLGEVVGLRVTNNRVISFSKGDNREVMVIIADVINGLGHDSQKVKLTLDARHGKVRKMTVSTEVQKEV